MSNAVGVERRLNVDRKVKILISSSIIPQEEHCQFSEKVQSHSDFQLKSFKQIIFQLESSESCNEVIFIHSHIFPFKSTWTFSFDGNFWKASEVASEYKSKAKLLQVLPTHYTIN